MERGSTTAVANPDKSTRSATATVRRRRTKSDRSNSKAESATTGPQTLQQIDNIQLQVNQKKSEFLEQKNQLLQNLQQVQFLQQDQEVNQFQMEGFFRVEIGDNLISKMQVEIVLRDGVVEEIRGDI